MTESTAIVVDKKTASYLAAQRINETNPYEVNIRNAARVLCADGKAHFRYDTQWLSGTTCWHYEVSRTLIKTLRVTVGGDIIR